MAKLLDDHLTYVSFPITKYEEDADGNLIVEGRVTDGSVDSDRQVVDPIWSGKALTDWMDSGPNLRVMHSPALYPAGRGLQVDLGSDAHNLRALVVEETAKKLVRNKVLRAYSVGIAEPVIKRDPTGKAPGGIITGGTLAEVSLVDRPANKNCQLVLAKSADSDVPWTYGDLDGLLAKAEAAGKKPRPDALGADDALDDLEDVPEDDAHAEDEEIPDAEDDDGKADVAEADLTKSAYDTARGEWLAREPGLNGAPTSGTAFLAKRVEWQRWHEHGEAEGLDDTAAGRARWLAKQGMDPAVGDGVGEPTARKGVKDCAECGAEHHADSKLRRCGTCGAKLPKADKTRKDTTVAKSGPPADVKTAVEHHEPDGSVEELDAEDQTDDGDSEDDAAEKSDAPYTVKRMHDALCAAYAWDTVAEEYPSLKGIADAVAPSFFTDQVQRAVSKGDMPLLAALASRANDAQVLAAGGVEVEKLADARAWLHKAFADLYPDTHLSPGAPPSPGQFQRPYISAGHAPLAAPADRPANIPPATYVPDPDDFQRGHLTAGQQSPSPSNKGDNLDAGGTLASGASRTFYRNASREAARGAMQSMHDHIAESFPDLCPMAASKAVMPPDMGDSNRPSPVRPMDPPAAPGEKTTAEPLMRKAKAGLSKKQAARLVKSAAAEAAKATAAIYETQIEALKAEIDELGAQPDPAQAPLRGAVVRKAATTEPVPTRDLSVVEKAQAQAVADRQAEIEFTRQFLSHPDITKREAAEARFQQLLAT